MISTTYDPEADVLHPGFGPADALYHGAEEVAPGAFLELDSRGTPIGIEIISVSRRAASEALPIKTAAE
jgi:uncharacterized protein YuzE